MPRKFIGEIFFIAKIMLRYGKSPKILYTSFRQNGILK